MIKFFSSAFNHLKTDGLFIFDFWYGPAVLNEKPAYRLKKIDNEEFSIRRFTKPDLLQNINVVNVTFETIILNREENKIEEIKEIHKMRYFFLPELRYMLKNTGFKVLKIFKWMTLEELDMNSWYGVIIAQK